MTHTVEKIGGTSMSRLDDLRDTLFRPADGENAYGRIFVVSAFGGITDLLLEQKKTGDPGVFGSFANDSGGRRWQDALARVEEAMVAAHTRLLEHPEDRARADAFVRDRIEGARTCLIDLQRICSYGHFRLSEHLLHTRELLSGLGEAHSAQVTTLLLRRSGLNATLVDLSGWRESGELNLEERLTEAMDGVDPSREMPIVTGYAQCREGLMQEFDRGYSEVVFSRLAALTGARQAVIHKEFHLSSADPNIVGVDAVRKIGRTNYDVADQLSNMGMEAIHPKAAKVLRQAGVPLRVTNAFEPGDPGTLIDDQPADASRVEIVTGIDIVALEVFEQDMAGVKGYDAAILNVLTRHNVRIVSKVSNANTITHYVDASLKVMRRVESDIETLYPTASVSSRPLSMVAVIGRDLNGLACLSRGLQAIADAGLEAIGASQGPRHVDVQFILDRDAHRPAIVALHRALIEAAEGEVLKVA